MIKAIETEYKGYRFRSRLEARWAVFFDTLGIAWEYEKEGYDLGEAGWYLPDFWLPEWECFVEIKPDVPNEKEMNKLSALARAMQQSRADRSIKEHYMICGTPGLPKIKFTLNEERIITVADGYVCLSCIGAHTDSAPDFTVSCFAMTDGGKRLDIWPLYLTEPVLYIPCEVTTTNIKGNNRELASICLQGGGMRRMYVGRGVVYDAINLRMAYAAARSARFEHGEHGTR
jgi:hypothetical protein